MSEALAGTQTSPEGHVGGVSIRVQAGTQLGGIYSRNSGRCRKEGQRSPGGAAWAGGRVLFAGGAGSGRRGAGRRLASRKALAWDGQGPPVGKESVTPGPWSLWPSLPAQGPEPIDPRHLLPHQGVDSGTGRPRGNQTDRRTIAPFSCLVGGAVVWGLSKHTGRGGGESKRLPGTLSPLTEWTGGEGGLGVLPVSGSCEWVSDSIPVVHLQDDLLPPVSSSERASSLPKDTQLGSTEPGDQPRGPQPLFLPRMGCSVQRRACRTEFQAKATWPRTPPPAPLGAWEIGEPSGGRLCTAALSAPGKRGFPSS